MFNQKIMMLDSNPEYIKLYSEAQEKFPDQPLNQLNYIKSKGNPQFTAIASAMIAQSVFVHPARLKEDYVFSGSSLDYFYRGLLDAIRHLDEYLPDGVFQYICSKTESFVELSLKQAEEYSSDQSK